MRIAYFVDGRMPTEKANGYQSAQMCQAFIEEGCEVDLFYPSRKNHLIKGDEGKSIIEDYYNLRVDINHRKISCVDFIYLFDVKLGFSSKSIIAKAASVFTSASAALSFSFRIRKGRYDMVFLRSKHALVWLCRFLPLKYLRSIFFEMHDMPKREATLKRLIKVSQSIGGIICTAGHMKKVLMERGTEANKIIVEHNGIDIKTFDLNISREKAREYLNIAGKGVIASFVGKFHTYGQEKGIPEIIRAAKYLVEEFPDLMFYFVGGPQDRVKVYMEIIEKEKLPAQRFVFLDKQPVQNVPYYLKASDILLVPHPWNEFYAYYVCPLKLCEYMIAAKPVVASRLPSIMEVLEDGKNALLGDPGSPESIAANIKRLLTDKQLSERIANRAYKDVQEYTWSKRAKRILGFINDKIQENG